jgi:hydroxymethylpyrimidine/phosphomethylpyrimidine kinase
MLAYMTEDSIDVPETKSAAAQADVNERAPAGSFQIVTIGALYTGIGRGLAADILAAHALGCMPLPLCTAIVAAGQGRVTDVIEVPADSVDAQLEHIFLTNQVDAVKIGIVGSSDAAQAIFRRLERHFEGPMLLDMTLSGPSGEDIASQKTLQIQLDRLSYPDLVTLRRQDASLAAGMEISSLDDAQIAAQRLHKLGARRILIRCGMIPTHFYEDSHAADQYVDLYYDGVEFSLFEAPALDRSNLNGASSALTLATLKNLSLKYAPVEAVQMGKAYVAEALHRINTSTPHPMPNYFWNQV